MTLLSDLAAELGLDSTELAAHLISGSDTDEALETSYLSVNPDGSLGALSFSGRTAQGGKGTVHWSSGSISDQLVVPHSLGVTPTAVVCTAVDPSTGIVVSTQVDFEVQNLTQTTFSVRATQPSGGVLVNLDFYWVAISGDRGLLLNFATGQVAGTAYNPLPFTANWDNYDVSPVCQYYNDSARVYISGRAKNLGIYSFGQPSADIARGLPAPSVQQQIVIPVEDATNGNGLQFLAIDTAGTLKLSGQYITSASGAVGSIAILTGFSYRL